MDNSNKTQQQPPASDGKPKKEVKTQLPGWHEGTTRIDHGNKYRTVP